MLMKSLLRTNVDESSVVLDALCSAALGVLLLVGLCDLGGLTTHLTGTSQGSVNLTCTTANAHQRCIGDAKQEIATRGSTGGSANGDARRE